MQGGYILTKDNMLGVKEKKRKRIVFFDDWSFSKGWGTVAGMFQMLQHKTDISPCWIFKALR
jgi:hypothetical protein